MTVTPLACDDQKSRPELPASCSLEKVRPIHKVFNSLQHRPEYVSSFMAHALSLQLGQSSQMRSQVMICSASKCYAWLTCIISNSKMMTWELSKMLRVHQNCAVAAAVVHLLTLHFTIHPVTKSVDAGSNSMPFYRCACNGSSTVHLTCCKASCAAGFERPCRSRTKGPLLSMLPSMI